jgi:hypothetical protein
MHWRVLRALSAHAPLLQVLLGRHLVLLASAYVPLPDPPQALPTFEPSYDMFESSIIMPCNYTGPFSLDASTRWGIVDIDWSNAKRQWVQAQPMRSQEELVAAAAAIRAVSNRTKVWIYRNLAWAPAWFT